MQHIRGQVELLHQLRGVGHVGYPDDQEDTLARAEVLYQHGQQGRHVEMVPDDRQGAGAVDR